MKWMKKNSWIIYVKLIFSFFTLWNDIKTEMIDLIEQLDFNWISQKIVCIVRLLNEWIYFCWFNGKITSSWAQNDGCLVIYHFRGRIGSWARHKISWQHKGKARPFQLCPALVSVPLSWCFPDNSLDFLSSHAKFFYSNFSSTFNPMILIF